MAQIYKILSKSYGYRGILYCNDKRKLIVWAHRGTKPKNIDSLKTDITSITNNNIGGQERLTSGLLKEITKLIDEDKKNYSFSSTGHSLGGWLAQITTFIGVNDSKQDGKRHFKAVTFDAPGAKPMLTKLNDGQKPLDLNDLDITNYVSSPNLVNCINPHIGTLYRVIFEKFPSIALTYTLKSHSSTNFVKAFDPIKGTPYKCLYIEKWPLITCNCFQIIYKSLKKVVLPYDFEKGNEFLGQYSGFFKFANDVNKYDPTELNRICNFELEYKYHYKGLKYNKHRSDLRHLSKQAYNLIKEAKNLSHLHYQVLRKNGISNIKLLGNGKKETDIELNKFNIIKAIDILEKIVRENPKLGKELTLDERYADHIWRRINYPEPQVGENEPNKYIRRDNLSPLEDAKHIINRETEILTIRNNFLKSHHSKWQAITSYGGVGKSTLAIQYALEYIDEFYNQVWWINAEKMESFRDGLEEISIFMKINSSISTKNLAIEIQKMLKENRRWLLILDNLKMGKKCKEDEDELTLNYIYKYLVPNQDQEEGQSQLGHVLITSRNSEKGIWEDLGIINHKLFPLNEKEAIVLLNTFRKPRTNKEKKVQKHIVDETERFPIVFNLIGKYVKSLTNDNKPYKKFLRRYNNEGKIEFLNSLEDKNKGIYKMLKISLKEVKTEQSEAIRILRIMSVINPCSIDNRLFHYLGYN